MSTSAKIEPKRSKHGDLSRAPAEQTTDAGWQAKVELAQRDWSLHMIRPNKPIQLLEWGQGTTTLNQVWTICGKGRIASIKQVDCITTMVIDIEGGFDKKNLNDNSIKLTQQGEGMAAHSEDWGEVGFGILKSVESQSGKRQVTVEIKVAAKVGKAHPD